MTRVELLSVTTVLDVPLPYVFVVLTSLALAGALFAFTALRGSALCRRGSDGGAAQRWSLDAGLRILSGDQSGLGRRWRHGRALVEPGLITLRPYRWGVRLLPQPPVSIVIVSVHRGGMQRAPWRSMFSVSPAARLVPVTTRSGATLQLAVMGPAAGPALDVLMAASSKPQM